MYKTKGTSSLMFWMWRVVFLACAFLAVQAGGEPMEMPVPLSELGGRVSPSAGGLTGHEGTATGAERLIGRGEAPWPGAEPVKPKDKTAGSAAPVLWEMLQSTEPATRVQALEGLVELGGAEGISAILCSLLDPDPGVRAASGKLLVSVEPDALFGQIMSVLCSGSYESVASLDAALPLLSGSLERKLLSTLASEEEPTARRIAAAYGLGRMGTRASTPVLSQSVLSPDWGLAVFSATALAAVADPAAEKLFLDLLDHPIWEVRSAAIDGLARLGSEPAKAALTALVSGERAADAALRQQAAIALSMMGDESVVPLLVTVMGRDPTFQHAAARTLRRLTGQRLGDHPGEWALWLSELGQGSVGTVQFEELAEQQGTQGRAQDSARHSSRQTGQFLNRIGLQGLSRLLGRRR